MEEFLYIETNTSLGLTSSIKFIYAAGLHVDKHKTEFLLMRNTYI